VATSYGGRWEKITDIPLGKGGQGVTFLVKDLEAGDGKQYALKRLLKRERLPRFQSEIDAIRAIQHPNVIKVIDANVENDPAYFVSEYCELGSMEDSWRVAEHDCEDALRVFIQICQGLAQAHAVGQVHRDIKPGNILLRADGTPVVADFGLSYVDGGQRQTLTWEAVGPRYFMAPEFEEGRVATPRASADVYSLGKLFHWMLTANRFSREKHREQSQDLVQISQDPSYEHANRLLDQMIVFEPERRLQNAGAVLAEAKKLARLWKGGYNALSPEYRAKYPQGRSIIPYTWWGRE
jgi:serine/threonine protein kinase